MTSPHFLKCWITNCTESARWLRSGQEYEQFFIQRGLTPLGLEDREKEAQEYERKAVTYQIELDAITHV